jgi:16S rRNA (cytosine967-C5)-methyltransferase
MTPQARLSAAIEVLDRLAAGRASADETLAHWGRANRYAGSKDRRAIAERVYRVLRERGRLAAAMHGDDGRALVLGSLAFQDGLPPGEIAGLFCGEHHAPAALSEAERGRISAAPPPAGPGLPGFIARELQRSFGEDWALEAEALLSARAPLDLRINARAASREQVASTLAANDVEVEPTPYSAFGLRAPAGVHVQGLDAFQAGLFEVQDEGSQIAAWLADARPGMKVVDYCAGGGGKTLALAQGLMAGHGAAGGRLYGFDTDEKRLQAIAPRLERAGVRAELRRIGRDGQGTEALERSADLVLVDAPCSGSGTWRRRPEQAWRLGEEELERFMRLQSAIVSRASSLVTPGGRLAYVTCSVLAPENHDVTEAFAAAHPDFRPLPVASAAIAASGLTEAGRARLAELAGGGHRVQLSPRRTGTDGFFVALFERTS